ncbi:hypothetical protein [Streptomyces anulatus]|uniref:hypothetical protein n=1 Tax=Streptomyces anulatus TaxID=1892 RepID=UPI0035D813C3
MRGGHPDARPALRRPVEVDRRQHLLLDLAEAGQRRRFGHRARTGRGFGDRGGSAGQPSVPAACACSAVPQASGAPFSALTGHWALSLGPVVGHRLAYAAALYAVLGGAGHHGAYGDRFALGLDVDARPVGGDEQPA